MDVLLGYATAHCSTRGIADGLAAELGDAGLKAEARAMGSVDDADAYNVFVLSGTIHGQTWLGPAKAFVRDNLDVLPAARGTAQTRPRVRALGSAPL
ncbi:flavodoxin domain-containing protein [Streptomyces sp. NPDC086554]|uniref:flavodoxin domain-containing protein n=1 Tax=Streptomyces sp. NPDC086554 TaxID=3154864 RepID=UPI00343A8A00